MKFPVKTCMGCGLDLTTVEPAEIKNPGEVALVGTCPQCSAPYFLVEDSASLPGPAPEPEVEPEPEAEPKAEAEEPAEPEE